MSSLGSSSATHAMADTYESHRGRLEEFRAHLEYVDGATGLAVGVGPTIVALDLFDKPATCRKIWTTCFRLRDGRRSRKKRRQLLPIPNW